MNPTGKLVSVQNQNPSDAERALYKYGGYYLASNTQDFLHYIPISLEDHDPMIQSYDDGYPKEILLLPSQIDWDTGFVINKLSETVKIQDAYIDISIIHLIMDRMTELGFTDVLVSP